LRGYRQATPSHLGSPFPSAAGRFRFDRFNSEVRFELKDRRVEVFQVLHHAAQGFVGLLDIAGKLDAAFD
jgi:hypothetical protein